MDGDTSGDREAGGKEQGQGPATHAAAVPHTARAAGKALTVRAAADAFPPHRPATASSPTYSPRRKPHPCAVTRITPARARFIAGGPASRDREGRYPGRPRSITT